MKKGDESAQEASAPMPSGMGLEREEKASFGNTSAATASQGSSALGNGKEKERANSGGESANLQTYILPPAACRPPQLAVCYH